MTVGNGFYSESTGTDGYEETRIANTWPEIHAQRKELAKSLERDRLRTKLVHKECLKPPVECDCPMSITERLKCVVIGV